MIYEKLLKLPKEDLDGSQIDSSDSELKLSYMIYEKVSI